MLAYRIACCYLVGRLRLLARGHAPASSNPDYRGIHDSSLGVFFALAVYTNSLFLLPRFAQRRLWLRYVISLVATIAALDLVVVLLVQFIYDRLWGADPLRYGFWFNMASDGFGIAVHLMAAMVVMWVARFLRRSMPPQPSAL